MPNSLLQHIPGAPKAIGPYSIAVPAPPFLFLSGQVALDPDTGKMVEGDITEQTKRVLANIDAVLVAYGLTRNSIVKTTIFLTDLGDFSIVNDIYGEWTGTPKPARSTVQVSALPRKAKIEIEAIALLNIP